MYGKKWAALLLALCLIVCACPGLAAPAREEQTIEITVDERLQRLLFILCEAIPEECFGDTPQTVLSSSQAPGAELATQALWAACLLYENTAHLTPGEADALYHQLFTNGSCPLEGSQNLYYLTADENGWAVNTDARPVGSCGARIYAAVFDGTDALVRCDVFDYQDQNDEGVLLDAAELDEAWVDWSCQMELSLRFAPETEFGFTLNSLSVSPLFRDGYFAAWQEISEPVTEDGENGFDVHLPESLAFVSRGPDGFLWQTEEGDASLRIVPVRENVTYDEAFSRYLLAHPGQKPVQERLYDCFIFLAGGTCDMVFTGDRLPFTYTLTMTFPEERQAEYELYLNIIRNSFGIWGFSNG